MAHSDMPAAKQLLQTRMLEVMRQLLHLLPSRQQLGMGDMGLLLLALQLLGPTVLQLAAAMAQQQVVTELQLLAMAQQQAAATALLRAAAMAMLQAVGMGSSSSSSSSSKGSPQQGMPWLCCQCTWQALQQRAQLRSAAGRDYSCCSRCHLIKPLEQPPELQAIIAAIAAVPAATAALRNVCRSKAKQTRRCSSQHQLRQQQPSTPRLQWLLGQLQCGGCGYCRTTTTRNCAQQDLLRGCQCLQRAGLRPAHSSQLCS